MKKLFYLLLFTPLFFSCKQTVPTELNVMTFNIRLDAASDSMNNWQYRKDIAAKVVIDNNIDVFGTQEVLGNQLNDLKERLPLYNAVGVAREDGKNEGEYCAVFYKKDRFTEVESGNFWLSETPDSVGSIGWDAACKRVATWAILADKESGKKFIILNTHLDHMGEVARSEGVKLTLDRAISLGKDLPIIVTGDFNANPESEVIKIMTDKNAPHYLIDSRSIATTPSGVKWTFHDFGRLADDKREYIDYIFVNDKIKVIKQDVLPEKINDIFVSDHRPVTAHISL